jgi:outer membrane protein TolC
MRRLLLGLAIASACGCGVTVHDILHHIILPEQTTLAIGDPDRLPPGVIPDMEPPRTVTNPQPQTPPWPLSLDEAIHIALENTQVVRVLAGVTAVASGQTIYDPAISNTQIDQAQARFDPMVTQNNTWDRLDQPFGLLNPLDPTRTLLSSSEMQDYRATAGLTKTNVLGGQWAVNWTDTHTQFGGNGPFPLNPQNLSALEVSYTQPLLQGGGYQVNMAPIVIARINTDQSFFQYKDSVQEMVRGVIEAYWNLVLARINVWARRIQVQQSEEQYRREEARLKSGLADISNVAQARVTYNQFRANLVAAEADQLTREAVLRNILGLPPSDGRQIVPVSTPTNQRLMPRWDEVVRLAEQRRPDIIELKLVTEADQVRLLQSENQALPRLDAVALYRWNGISGTLPNGQHIASEPGQFPDWSFGVNFSVPLGLRQGRALVRQQALLIARDRANVDQALHAAAHELASSVRDMDSAYDQYLAFKETRAAAYANLQVQIAQFDIRRTIYLNVLQALNDWGNAVSSEAQQLLNYNIALATLERRTGTILETHGLVFSEERFRAAGPLGICGHGRLYPAAVPPAGHPQRYPSSGQPAENAFDLTNPAPRMGSSPAPAPR